MQKTAAYLFFLLCCLIGNANPAPQAIRGQIDLRTVDLNAGHSFGLDGEWEFYPGQLLTPEDFSRSDPARTHDYLNLPSAWNGAPGMGGPLNGHGTATFRLRVIPPAQHEHLALRVYNIHAAYRLWINGKPISKRGALNSKTTDEVSDISLDMPDFHNDGSPLELVFAVSNHHYLAGGIIESIRIGLPDVVQQEQSIRWGLALFFIGSLLMMGCYHLVFFFFRRSGTIHLIFGLYCLLWMGFFLTSKICDRIILLFFPGIPGEALLRTLLLCFLVLVPVGHLFFLSQFPQEFSKRPLIVLLLVFGAFSLLTLFAPLAVALTANVIYFAAALILIVYCLVTLYKALRAGREGAAFILGGFSIVGTIATNDMLHDLGLIHSRYLMPLGVFLFIMSQGLALSRMLSLTFVAVEDLTANLKEKNQALETEMAERFRLETEIVNLSENERRSLSRELHDGLCQELVAARFYCAALKEDLAGRKVYTQVETLSKMLDEGVNHAYGLSRGLWPVEHGEKGMGTFLEEFCRRLAASSGVDIRFRNRRACADCGNEAVIHLYRIAQEAIANAVKHARASLIEVDLDCSAYLDHIALSVRDNGIGRKAATPSSGGLGMAIMAHRARIIHSELSITDIPTGGTEVRCTMHCAHDHTAPRQDTTAP